MLFKHCIRVVAMCDSIIMRMSVTYRKNITQTYLLGNDDENFPSSFISLILFSSSFTIESEHGRFLLSAICNLEKECLISVESVSDKLCLWPNILSIEHKYVLRKFCSKINNNRRSCRSRFEFRQIKRIIESKISSSCLCFVFFV